MKSRVVAGAAAALFVAAPAVQAGGHSEQLVVGDTRGNHDLACVVIRPWADDAGPDDRLYPVIGWANGWDQGDVVGEVTALGYKPGLIEWALDRNPWVTEYHFVEGFRP